MTQPSLNPSEFDQFASDYDAALNQGLSASGEDKTYFARGRIQHLAGRLDELQFRPESILDFGCGTGTATPYFLEAWPQAQRILGTDISAASLDVARRTHGSDRVQFRLMAEHAPAADIDLAYCNGVFHHIPLDQRADALSYVYKCLRPGGIFALWENNPWNPGTRYVMSRIPFDRDAITLSAPHARRLAQAAGFQPLRTDFLFIFPRLLRWFRPLERLITFLPLGGQYMVLVRKPC